MPGRSRYDTKVEDGELFVERDDGWLRIGPMDAVVERLGGETYRIEYTDEEAAAAWLDTDADNSITIDVRSSITGMSFTDEFVRNLESAPLDETDDEGVPVRTGRFADLMLEILESKGNLDGEVGTN